MAANLFSMFLKSSFMLFTSHFSNVGHESDTFNFSDFSIVYIYCIKTAVFHCVMIYGGLL